MIANPLHPLLVAIVCLPVAVYLGWPALDDAFEWWPDGAASVALGLVGLAAATAVIGKLRDRPTDLSLLSSAAAVNGSKESGLLAAVLLVLVYLAALAYLVSLLTGNTLTTTTMIALAFLGIAGFAILLFGIAVAFRGLDALDVRYAFGLPRGTVRAVIALGLLVAFLMGSIYWIDRASIQPTLELTPHELPPGAEADLEEIQEALGPEIVVFWTVEKQPVRDEQGNLVKDEEGKPVEVEVRTLHLADRSNNQARLDLIKQVITVLSTALAAVVGFYFGSRSTEASDQKGAGDTGADVEAGKDPAKLEEARALMGAVSTDVQRAKNAADKAKTAYDKAKESGGDSMAIELAATDAEGARKAYAEAHQSESQARGLVKEIEEALTKLGAKATTREQAAVYREQIAKALKTLKQQSVLAQAAADRAQKLADRTDV